MWQWATILTFEDHFTHNIAIGTVKKLTAEAHVNLYIFLQKFLNLYRNTMDCIHHTTTIDHKTEVFTAKKQRLLASDRRIIYMQYEQQGQYQGCYSCAPVGHFGRPGNVPLTSNQLQFTLHTIKSPPRREISIFNPPFQTKPRHTDQMCFLHCIPQFVTSLPAEELQNRWFQMSNFKRM